MKFEFTENADLDAQLMIAAKKSHFADDKEAEFDRLAKAAGVSGMLEALLRGIWYLKTATQEYRDKVNARLSVLDPNYAEMERTKLKTDHVIINGEEVTRIELQSPDPTNPASLGLESTPEITEFINQVAEAASVGGPLAQPYIAAGAIKVYKKQIAPGIEVQGIGFHKTKFAEMLKSPASHMN